MKNEILEVLKGLGEAKEKRVAKLADLANCDDTAIIEEKKAELQKELEEKLAEFVDGINGEREKAVAKLNRDLETIDELIGEYNEKLAVAQEEEKESEEVEVANGVETDGAKVAETVQESVLGTVCEGVNNPYRP